MMYYLIYTIKNCPYCGLVKDYIEAINESGIEMEYLEIKIDDYTKKFVEKLNGEIKAYFPFILEFQNKLEAEGFDFFEAKIEDLKKMHITEGSQHFKNILDNIS